MKNLESIKKAIADVGFLVEDLQEANMEASLLEHIILIELIESAYKLQTKIRSIYLAIEGEK